MQEAECQQHLQLAEHKDRKITITGRGEIHNKRVRPHRGVHHLTPGIIIQIDPVQILSIDMIQTRPIARREVAGSFDGGGGTRQSAPASSGSNGRSRGRD